MKKREDGVVGAWDFFPFFLIGKSNCIKSA